MTVKSKLWREDRTCKSDIWCEKGKETSFYNLVHGIFFLCCTLVRLQNPLLLLSLSNEIPNLVWYPSYITSHHQIHNVHNIGRSKTHLFIPTPTITMIKKNFLPIIATLYLYQQHTRWRKNGKEACQRSAFTKRNTGTGSTCQHLIGLDDDNDVDDDDVH